MLFTFEKPTKNLKVKLKNVDFTTFCWNEKTCFNSKKFKTLLYTWLVGVVVMKKSFKFFSHLFFISQIKVFHFGVFVLENQPLHCSNISWHENDGSYGVLIVLKCERVYLFEFCNSENLNFTLKRKNKENSLCVTKTTLKNRGCVSQRL